MFSVLNNHIFRELRVLDRRRPAIPLSEGGPAVGGRDPGDSGGAAPSAFFFFENRPNSDSFGVGCRSDGAGAGAGLEHLIKPASRQVAHRAPLARSSSARSGQK